MNASVNVNLNIEFYCPHCEDNQGTHEHGCTTSIETGTYEIECTSCKKVFELDINEYC